MRESTIERQTVAAARARGWTSFKLNGPGDAGKPDRLFLSHRGEVRFVEFKAPGKLPTKLQQRAIQALRDRGFEVYVIDSVDAGRELFNA